MEWYGDKEQNPPAAEDVRRELRVFVDGVEAACGQKLLIYAGNDIYDRYLRGYFDDCELWIACRKWPAWVEWPRGGWTIWQYSDTGELAGASNEAGHVDSRGLSGIPYPRHAVENPLTRAMRTTPGPRTGASWHRLLQGGRHP